MLGPRERPHYAKAPLTHAFLRVAFERVDGIAFETLGLALRDALGEIMPCADFELQHADESDEGSAATGVFVRSLDSKTWALATATSCIALRVKPYESWEQFYPVFATLWSTYTREVVIGPISQIGVKYTNQFELTPEAFDAPLQSVVNVYPTGIDVEGMTSISKSANYRLSDDSVDFEIVINDGPDPEDGVRRIILDLDANASKSLLSRVEGVDVHFALDRLHSRIDDVFNAAITKETRVSLG